MIANSDVRKEPVWRAFTLVELLVVIAIVSILAGLLLPALEDAVESARRIACLGNQKQMYVAWAAYADEFDDCLPAHDFHYGLEQPYTNRTLAYSPIKYWMIYYAGLPEIWENWSPSGGGMVWECDALSAPEGSYGPYPVSRDAIVYCPSVEAYNVNAILGTDRDTRRGNVFLSYYFSGLGACRAGWRRDYIAGTGMWEYIGGTRLSRLAEGIKTQFGNHPYQFFGDYTIYGVTAAAQPGYMLNHTEKGGNFTRASGDTRWVEHSVGGDGPWLGTSFRTCGEDMYVQRYVGQPLFELQVNGEGRIGQAVGSEYRGCLTGQTADDIMRSMGYRRSTVQYFASLPY